MKYIFLIFMFNFVVSQNIISDNSRKDLTFEGKQYESVEIVTNDGNIFLGDLVEETDTYYKLLTRNGILIEVPKSSVEEIQILKTAVISGTVYRADPNKSMYFFTPSAYPIGNSQRYCRDFCLFFPSYNRGIGDNISIQAGAFLAPGMDYSLTPIVLSGKYSFPSSIEDGIDVAAGIMYITLPVSDTGAPSQGAGISFITSTIGNHFTHTSLAFGWGYVYEDDKWDFSHDPLINIATNIRASNNIAILAEFWKFPTSDISTSPIMIAGRFIGRKLAVDLGCIFVMEMFKGNDFDVPLPLLNFTYHFSK